MTCALSIAEQGHEVHLLEKDTDLGVMARRIHSTQEGLDVQAYVEMQLWEVRKCYADWEYVAIGIDVDHVHLYMVIPPEYSVSYAVETLKKNASLQFSLRFRFLSQVYWDNHGVWSRGFFVSTEGARKKVVQDHVNMQAKENTG